jgi:ADP-dependent phosphofructokinase/glucokinase
VLFTRVQFGNIQNSIDEKSKSETDYNFARDEVSRLNSIESKLNSSEIDVSKYINEVDEDDIIEYIFDYIEKDNKKMDNTGEVIVRSISLREGKINET